MQEKENLQSAVAFPRLPYAEANDNRPRRRREALELSFVPHGHERWQPRRENPGIIELRATTFQYRRIATCVLSQEERLLNSGRIRKKTGYDMSDPWLNDDRSDERLVHGAPIGLIGTGKVASYMGPIAGSMGLHKAHCLGSGPSLSLPRSAFMPLPTRPPQTGEWAVAMGLMLEEARFNGECGFCGPAGRSPVLECDQGASGTTARSAQQHQGLSLWVTFTPPGSSRDLFATMLISVSHLAALPTAPPGTPFAPLDAKVAPASALPPLADNEEHEHALIIARRNTAKLLSEQRLADAHVRSLSTDDQDDGQTSIDGPHRIGALRRSLQEPEPTSGRNSHHPLENSADEEICIRNAWRKLQDSTEDFDDDSFSCGSGAGDDPMLGVINSGVTVPACAQGLVNVAEDIWGVATKIQGSRVESTRVDLAPTGSESTGLSSICVDAATTPKDEKAKLDGLGAAKVGAVDVTRGHFSCTAKEVNRPGADAQVDVVKAAGLRCAQMDVAAASNPRTDANRLCTDQAVVKAATQARASVGCAGARNQDCLEEPAAWVTPVCVMGNGHHAGEGNRVNGVEEDAAFVPRKRRRVFGWGYECILEEYAAQQIAQLPPALLS